MKSFGVLMMTVGGALSMTGIGVVAGLPLCLIGFAVYLFGSWEEDG